VKTKKRRWLINLLGIALFIFILTRVDVSSVLSTISKVNAWYLATAVVLIIPAVFLKSWRWQLLLRMQGVDYSLRQAFPAYFGGIFMGLVTPGRLGELGRVFYLATDRNLSFGRALSSVVVDRLADVCLLLLIGGYGLISLSLPPGRSILTVSVLALLLVLPLLLLSKGIGKGFIGLVYRTKLFGRFVQKIDASTDQFYSGVESLTKPSLVLPLLITLAAYAVLFSQYYLLVLALNLPLSFLHTAVYAAVATLLALIPVSIAGIGTRDATLIALFSLHDIGAESALSYSLLVLLTFYVCAAALGAIAWQIKPVRLSRERHSDEEA
jgi:uncharacterized protein (TIRG00374 family)